MVSWKLLKLSAARWKVILARGKKTEVIAVQVITSCGRWLEIIAKMQECVCVIRNKSSTSAAEPVAIMITNLSGPVSHMVCCYLLCFIRSIL